MFQFSIHAGNVKEPVKEEKTNESVVTNSEKKDKAEDIRSVELLYTIAQNEYSNEYERTNMIHSKAGIALPIISTYFLALIQMNNYKEIFAISATDIWTSLVPILLFISYTAAAVLSLLSVAYMAKVVFAKSYMRINAEDLCTTENLTMKHQDFIEKLMKTYFKTIKFNINANNDRMKLYKRSWIYTFYSVLCFVVYIVVKNNI